MNYSVDWDGPGERDRETLVTERAWNLVGDGTPLNAVLETRREGEAGTNFCHCRVVSIGDEPEWVEESTGRTTVTHHSFAAPTHWRWPEGKPAFNFDI